MTTHTPFQLGSISAGTLKPEDLLPILVQLDPLLVKKLSQILLDDADGIGFPQGILDALNNLCPPFIYFGVHPSDRGDFGFWPDWDALSNKSHDPLNDGVLVKWHGSDVTILDLNRNILWTTV